MLAIEQLVLVLVLVYIRFATGVMIFSAFNNFIDRKRATPPLREIDHVLKRIPVHARLYHDYI